MSASFVGGSGSGTGETVFWWNMGRYPSGVEG